MANMGLIRAVKLNRIYFNTKRYVTSQFKTNSDESPNSFVTEHLTYLVICKALLNFPHGENFE